MTAENMLFSFSDTISGYVTSYDAEGGFFGLRTSDGRDFEVRLTDSTYAELLRNLGQPYTDASGPMREMLTPGRYLSAYGVFYPEAGGHVYEAKRIVFVGRTAADYQFERPNWWIDQVNALAAFYRRAQFGTEGVDYRDYRTVLRLGGDKTDSHVQETDTISRMVYGMASAYMITGNEDYLEVAEKGTDYLRDHMRFVDRDEDVTYWYHGVRVEGDRETKLFTSEFGDDYDAIPMYEQIYALAGPTQTYRVTGDPRIMTDIEGTLNLFAKFFRDEKGGGYYSHIDPILLDAHTESLGLNRAKKNWNSVGDHAPAYLVNLYLATGEERHADFLEDTFDTIARYFPDYDHSPFVNERFTEDWSHDVTYGWQQDRAVVGHNLKIAWNLMRMNSLRPKDTYRDLAERIGDLMPSVGSDVQRGGWYDVVERVLKPGQEVHRFVWHDRKAWWQQEQAILAYLILAGETGSEEYLRLGREASAFYNTYFLDHDEGAVYFNVLANGMPYLLGTERFKGSHSMSMYHSAELCFLAAVYTNLLLTRTPMDFWFKPYPGGLPDGILRVQPDILPAGSVRITEVRIDDKPYDGYDAEALTVTMPATDERVTVRVTLTPTAS
ncbi:MAG: N-acyl-D-glucosamine 2-epimerase [Frankiales bacterium]|jgi:mannose/cellobiose epimerase-like protein (N-acyl-D-glucosamine 2-epimerase family)|nr:N-acyl-D-glucosamine 2-epimerase [Frankiales bacterium]